MATSSESYGLISDVIAEAKADQSVAKRKANTVTSGVGVGITAVLAGVTYVVESGLAGDATWVPLVVALLGGVATVAGVSFTPNGITERTEKHLNDVLNKRIDQAHEHGNGVGLPQNGFPEQPSSDISEGLSYNTNTTPTESNPDELLQEARRLAGG